MREAKAQAAKRQTNNYEGQSLSESKEIKAREPRVHMCTNLVPRPSLPPTACICILQVTKNWSREQDYIHTTCLCTLYPNLGMRLRGLATHPNYL